MSNQPYTSVINSSYANTNLGNILASNTSSVCIEEYTETHKNPFCRINLTKSDNDGFIMEMYNYKSNEYATNRSPKTYVINSSEDLGKVIQNAIMIEIIKQ